MKEEDLWWLIGFVEAAGSFTRNTTVILREDRTYRYTTPQFFLTSSDPSAVEAVRSILGMGRVTLGGRRLEVRRKEELFRLATLLDGKLRTERRRREFTGWKALLLQWKRRGDR
jgi:hypothetical protein